MLVKIIETGKTVELSKVQKDGSDSARLLDLYAIHDTDQKSGAYIMSQSKFNAYSKWLKDFDFAEAVEKLAIETYGDALAKHIEEKREEYTLYQYPYSINEIINDYLFDTTTKALWEKDELIEGRACGNEMINQIKNEIAKINTNGVDLTVAANKWILVIDNKAILFDSKQDADTAYSAVVDNDWISYWGSVMVGHIDHMTDFVLSNITSYVNADYPVKHTARKDAEYKPLMTTIVERLNRKRYDAAQEIEFDFFREM